jgi:hypothetical protein
MTEGLEQWGNRAAWRLQVNGCRVGGDDWMAKGAEGA